MKRFTHIGYKGRKINRRFGVEIEGSRSNMHSNNDLKAIVASCSEHKISLYDKHKVRSTKYSSSINNDFWHIKPDATCGNNWDRGWEVASPVSEGYEDAMRIGEVVNRLRIGLPHKHPVCPGLKVNRRCGFHVHVDVGDLSKSQVGRLLAYWVAIEKHILASLPLFRKLKTDYFTPLSSFLSESFIHQYKGPSWWDGESFYTLFRPASKYPRDNSFRYRAVNIVNYNSFIEWLWDRPTIEFRVAEGSMQRKDIVNWIRLYLNFVDTVVTRRGMPEQWDIPLEEALTYLGLNHDKTFYILSPELQETKTWFLERIIRNAKKDYPLFEIENARRILNQMWNPVKHY